MHIKRTWANPVAKRTSNQIYQIRRVIWGNDEIQPKQCIQIPAEIVERYKLSYCNMQISLFHYQAVQFISDRFRVAENRGRSQCTFIQQAVT